MSNPIEPFDDTARYERFMGRWSRCLAPAFIAFCDIGRAHRVLDVGCGTGAMCDALDATFPACHVTGADLSLEFVRHCRARLPLARFSFDRANAAELPYQDARFDAALSLLPLAAGVGPAGVYLGSLSSQQRLALRDRLRRRVDGMAQQGGALAFPATALMVRGIRCSSA